MTYHTPNQSSINAYTDNSLNYDHAQVHDILYIVYA